MANITPPRVGIPLGTIEIAGKRYEMQTHPEWVRFLSDLLNRGGGVTGTSTEDLALSQFEDAGIEEIRGDLFRLSDAVQQLPPATQPEPARRVAVVAVNTTLDDGIATLVMTASGKTVTMPACSGPRLGKEWTIILASNGYVDIVAADTVQVDGGQTTLRLDNYGASITLRCTAVNAWGIV